MRSLRVRYTETAISDLLGIHAYISQNNPGAATEVGLAIERAITLLSLFPHKSRKLRLPGWYALPVTRYPYIIFFKIKRDELEILHIRHAARRHPGFQEPAFEFAR